MAQFGEYEILAKLGQGGMGAVYKARHTASGRMVALKVVSSAAVLSATSRARFLAEARSMARFHHSNIVSLYEVGEVKGTPFLAMEFIEGRPLSDVLSERIPDTRQAATWMLTITNAMAHAHAAGIIHRDLKPGNVMINLRGEPMIMDFGIAKDVGADLRMTVAGQIIGTPAYMSPEQGEGTTVDFRSDVFSLGGILYTLLTGLPPFIGPSSAAIMLKVIQEDPVPPSQLAPGTDRTLEAICLKALRKDPAERYQTAEAMCADLSAFMVGGGVTAKSGRFGPQPIRLPKLRPRAVAGVGVGVLALSALVWTTWQYGSSSTPPREAPPPIVPAAPPAPIADRPAPARTIAAAPSPVPAMTAVATTPTPLVRPPEPGARTVEAGDRCLRRWQFEEALAIYEAAGAEAPRKDLAQNAIALREAAAQALTSGGRAPVVLQSGERATACSISRASVVLADTQVFVTSKAWPDLAAEDVYRIYRAALKQPTPKQQLALGGLCLALGLKDHATEAFDEAVRADPAAKSDADRLQRIAFGG